MFRSAQEALKFAFNTTNRPILKMSGINSMRGAEGNGDLTPHDRHAQAAIILSIMERSLTAPEVAWVRAAYGYEIRSDGPYKPEVLTTLVKVAMSGLPTGVHQRRGVTMMVSVYFVKRYGMRSVQNDLKCNNRRYYEYKLWIGNMMQKLGIQAEDAAHRALDAAGLIMAEVEA